MKITAICLTYRRPDLLEEALQSFLMQDYSAEKELIILNDEPEQVLQFKHPQVIIKNMSARAPDLATKYNFAASLATGQMIVPWDDDDVYLPHRFSTIAARQQGNLWFTDNLFTDDEEGRLILASGKIHCNHAYSPGFLIRAGAYHKHPDVISASGDFVLVSQLRGAVRMLEPDNIRPSYIYRKNSTASKNHSSMYIEDTKKQWQNYAAANGEYKKGEINLNPRWSCNWQTLADEAMARNPIPQPLNQLDKNFSPASAGTTGST